MFFGHARIAIIKEKGKIKRQEMGEKEREGGSFLLTTHTTTTTTEEFSPPDHVGLLRTDSKPTFHSNTFYDWPQLVNGTDGRLDHFVQLACLFYYF